MGNALDEEVACQAMLDDVVPLEDLQQGSLKTGDVALTAVVEVVGEGGGVVHCSHQIGGVDAELLRGIE